MANAGPDQTADVGETLTFDGTGSVHDPKGYVKQYYWNFGDGQRDRGAVVSHAFAASGQYTVYLTVLDNCWRWHVDTTVVTVGSPDPCANNAAPRSDAGPDQFGAMNTLITLSGSGSTDEDGEITGYWWNFGDGAWTGWQSSPSAPHAYFFGGTYAARLWVRDDCGAVSSYDSVNVVVGTSDPCAGNVWPIAEAGTPKEIELGTPITLSGSASNDPDGEIQSYTWDFGDAQTGAGRDVTHTYALSGEYTVTLSVTDDCGAVSAIDTTTVSVTEPDTCANNQPPVAAAGADREAQPGQVVSFDGRGSTDADGSIGTYAWSFGDGQNAHGATVGHVYSQTGTYVASLTVVDACQAYHTDTLTVTVVSADPCTNNTAPTANAGPDRTGSAGSPVSFNGDSSFDAEGSSLDYWWNFGDGQSTGWQSGASAQHAYVSGGSYTVKLWVRDECNTISALDSALAVIDNADPCLGNSSPVANAGGSKTGDVNVPITFDGGVSYDTDGTLELHRWTFGDGQSADGKIVTHAYAGEGSYTARLTVTDDCGATASAQASVVIDPAGDEEELDPQLTGFIPGLGDAGGVAIDQVGASRYAYVASENFGLGILDVTNPTQPTLVATLGPNDIPTSANHVAVAGGIAVIGGPTKVTTIVDVSNPLVGPRVMGSISVAASGLAIDGAYAYIASGAQGLRIVNVDDAPQIVSSTSMFALGVELMDIDSKVWAFVAAGRDGLKLLNVTDPATPILLDATLPVGAYQSAAGVALYVTPLGRVYAYVATTSVYIFDVTNPYNATAVGTIPIGGFIGSMSVTNDQLVLAVSNPGALQVYDLANPASPALRGSVNVYTEGIASDGDWVFAGSSTDGLRVISLSDPTRPVVKTTFSSAMSTRRAIALQDDYAVVGGPTDVTRLISLSDPGAPEEVDSLLLASFDLAMLGSHAYLATGVQGFKIVDLSSGMNIVGSRSSKATGVVVWERGNERWAALAIGRNGVEIVNITVPSAPVLVATIPVATNDNVSGLSLHRSSTGQTTLAAYNFNVYLIDATDPRQASLMGTMITQPLTVKRMCFTDTAMIVAAAREPGPDELRVYGIDDPANPTLRSTSMLDEITGLASNGRSVLVTGANVGTWGMWTVDLSDPADPVVVHSITPPGSVSSVATVGGLAVLGDDASKLDVISLYGP